MRRLSWGTGRETPRSIIPAEPLSGRRPMLNERKGWNRRRTILLIVFALVVLAVIGVFLLVTRLIADRARTAALHELGQTFASTGAAPCEPGSMGQSGSVAEVECI